MLHFKLYISIHIYHAIEGSFFLLRVVFQFFPMCKQSPSHHWCQVLSTNFQKIKTTEGDIYNNSQKNILRKHFKVLNLTKEAHEHTSGIPD